MSNKILVMVLLLGLANLAASLGVACTMCDCSSDCPAAALPSILVEDVAPPVVPTAKHEKYQPAMGSNGPLPEVNTRALLEKKGQQSGATIETEADRLAKQYGARILPSEYGGYYASLPEGYVWEMTGEGGTCSAPNHESLARQMARGVRPFHKPQPQVPPQVKPQAPSQQPSVAGDRPLHSLNRGRVLLFVDASPKSATLRTWFDNHAGLRGLRDECDFVVYQQTDPLYKSLFASHVTPEDFPAVIVADERGARIYGAARDAIPGSDEELYAAIRQGAEYLAQSQSGELTAAGYSNPPCYGPNCQVPQQQPPTPQYDNGQRLPREGGLVDRLRNRAEEKSAGIVEQALWGWVDDMVLLVAVILAFVLINKHLNNQSQQQQ